MVGRKQWHCLIITLQGCEFGVASHPLSTAPVEFHVEGEVGCFFFPEGNQGLEVRSAILLRPIEKDG